LSNQWALHFLLANTDSLESKQQKATAIAGRLLKELANEQLASHHQSEEQVKPALEKHVDTEEDESDDSVEEVDFMPSMDDLYQIYNNRYPQLADEEESTSSEIDDDEEMFPMDKQQLMNLMSEQDDSK
jgi:hypothetical protein